MSFAGKPLWINKVDVTYVLYTYCQAVPKTNSSLCLVFDYTFNTHWLSFTWNDLNRTQRHIGTQTSFTSTQKSLKWPNGLYSANLSWLENSCKHTPWGMRADKLSILLMLSDKGLPHPGLHISRCFNLHVLTSLRPWA